MEGSMPKPRGSSGQWGQPWGQRAQWRWSEQLFASFLSLPMTDVIVNESGKDEWTEGRGRVPRSDG